MKLTELLLNRFLYKESLQNIETKDSSYNAGNVIEETPPPVPAGGSAQDINTSNVSINTTQLVGPIPPALLDVANWGWTQTCAFTSTDLDTVSWGAGSFKSASGVVYTISAGNTGNMSAKTYIYLDLNVSPTAYQITTTPATSVGLGKVLIAVAQNGASSATYNLNEASQIVGDNILANTINATKMNVGQLSAITADLGTITAGTVTGALIRTAASGTRISIGGGSNEIQIYNGSTLRAVGYQNGWDYYNASSTLIGQIFADSNSLVFQGNVAETTASLLLGVGATGAVAFWIGTSQEMTLDSTGFHPTNATNALDLGNSVRRWENIWANGNIRLGGAIELLDSVDGSHYITIKAPALSGGWDLVLPTTDGNAGEVLTTDGSGNTSWAAASAGANTALSNLASVAINTSLISDSDGIDSLGSSTYAWKSLYLGNGGNIYYDAAIAFDFVSSTGIFVGSAGGGFDEFSPYTNLGVNLGSASYKWNSLFVDSIEVDALTVTTNITMSTAYIDGVTAIYFDDRSTAPGSPGNGTMYAYTSGGTYQMRVYLNGTWYSFNLTAV